MHLLLQLTKTVRKITYLRMAIDLSRYAQRKPSIRPDKGTTVQYNIYIYIDILPRADSPAPLYTIYHIPIIYRTRYMYATIPSSRPVTIFFCAETASLFGNIYIKHRGRHARRAASRLPGRYVCSATYYDIT